MLSRLRTVSPPTALALFAAGAATAFLLAMILDGDSGSTTAKRKSAAAAKQATPDREAKRSPQRSGAESLPRPQRPSVEEMIGQRFMVGLRGASPTPALLADARRGEIGGVVVFPEESTSGEVEAAIASLQREAEAGGHPRLLVAVDQEGGPVKRFPQGPPKAPLSSLSPGSALEQGEATGLYLRERGINVDLAPVVDLGLPGSFMTAQGRTISADPRTVIGTSLAFASGLHRANVMPVAKHFPGLGLAADNTDEERSVIEGELGDSLEPFRAWIASDMPAIMVGTAIYTSLDPDNGAAWSPAIVNELLREQLGFRGLVVSDDLTTPGIAASPSIPAATIAAVAAGIDVLMIVEPEDFRDAYEATLRVAEKGDIPREVISSSYHRIIMAKEAYAR